MQTCSHLLLLPTVIQKPLANIYFETPATRFQNHPFSPLLAAPELARCVQIPIVHYGEVPGENSDFAAHVQILDVQALVLGAPQKRAAVLHIVLQQKQD